MGGSHTIVHRPVSRVYAQALVANTTSAPLQLIPNTNELANFVYVLNPSNDIVLVNLKSLNQTDTLALPTSGNSSVGTVIGSNSYLVLAAPTPTCFVTAVSTIAATIYFQLMQNQ